jgi:DNA-binding cell septation regulator SpoVG
MNLTEFSIKKLDTQTETLVGTYSLCFEKVMHVDGFRVYYSASPKHQYSVAFPSNFTVDSPKIRKQIVHTVLQEVDKEITNRKIKPYTLNDSTKIKK